ADVCESQGRLDAAGAALETALRARPDWTGALFNHARVLYRQERPAEAEAALRRLVSIDPADASAWGLLGDVLRARVRVPEALEALARARSLAPDRFDLQSAELFMLQSSEGASAEGLFERHRQFGARLEAAIGARFAPFANAPDPERRLRVGYVSGDFHTHPVAFFMIPLLERHDRERVRTFCYSTGRLHDRITEEVRARAHEWRDASWMPDAELADAVNGDGIDILVDLSGHSGVSRLPVFAQQPAPVQVAWLGYLATTGLTRMQYRLCDRYTDPPGAAERFHTEKLVRLPACQWCYRPPVGAVPCADVPPFVRNGFLTFGSFNAALKISPSIRRLWARILERVPGSRLKLVGIPQESTRREIVADLAAGGIAPDRISASPRLGLLEYFEAFAGVDVALDPAPYSGGTTTCDTLWMGVPVVTAPGERSISRSAGSILHTLGLDDWIAASPEDYVERAVRCDRERERLVALRRDLRETLRASPLMDEPRFARDIEAAYRGMWRAWCRARGAPST
ncbi:MAG TPA: tetratricopeptide repeat protein, partial [Burkholderiales bacterium]